MAALRREPPVDHLGHAQRLEVLGRLAMSVAHELGNVLEVIGANAQVVAESGDPGVREAARDIQEAERTGRELVRQLLAHGRCEPHPPEVLDLVGLTVTTIRFLDRALGRTHRLTLDAHGWTPVRASRTELAQVLTNLVMNARDAMPCGGTVRVHVRNVPRRVAEELGSGVAAEEQVVLEVEDHGVGIPAEVIPRIFQPFFTTKPPGDGTGLGLAMVRDIVTRGGGEIVVASAPGRGSMFRVFLPGASAAGDRRMA
jgi:signal transduction histidine kinase